MPIITGYKVFGYSKNGEIVIENTEQCLCSKCGKGILKYRGQVRRHIRLEGTGEKVWYLIPLGKCDNPSCGATQRMLPDFIPPYKHYETQAISDALDDDITKDNVDSPSEQTMARWKTWLEINRNRIEGFFRSVGYKVLGYSTGLLFSTESILEKLRKDTGSWLEIVFRFVYNSGNHLEPFYPHRQL